MGKNRSYGPKERQNASREQKYDVLLKLKTATAIADTPPPPSPLLRVMYILRITTGPGSNLRKPGSGQSRSDGQPANPNRFACSDLGIDVGPVGREEREEREAHKIGLF